MLALLKIEWLKLKKYRAFWWMLGIVMLTLSRHQPHDVQPVRYHHFRKRDHQ